MREVTVCGSPPGKRAWSVELGQLKIVADEPLGIGGDDVGPRGPTGGVLRQPSRSGAVADSTLSALGNETHLSGPMT
jgi:hypothetical protein